MKEYKKETYKTHVDGSAIPVKYNNLNTITS